METFKQNIMKIFGEDQLFVLNLEYFYDAIGEDFNALVKYFEEYPIKIPTKNKSLPIYSPEDETALYDMLILFCKKLSKYKYIFSASIIKLMLNLMYIIQRKAHCEISVPCFKYSAMTINNNDWYGQNGVSEYESETAVFLIHQNYCLLETCKIERETLFLKYISIERILGEIAINEYDQLQIYTLDEFVKSPNNILMRSFVKFLFKDDSENFLNLNYVCETLESNEDFMKAVDKVRRKMKEILTKGKKSLSKCFEPDKFRLCFKKILAETASIKSPPTQIMGFELRIEVFIAWISLILSNHYKIIFVSEFHDSITYNYVEKNIQLDWSQKFLITDNLIMKLFFVDNYQR
jgi:hypothetical protein